MRQVRLGLLLLFLGVIILLIQITADARRSHEPALFYISGMGEQVSQYPMKEGEYGYSVTLDNPTKRTFHIHSVEPVLSRSGEAIVVGSVKPVTEGKSVRPGKDIQFQGTIIVSTSKLSEEEIKRLMPVVIAYKIKYNRNEEVILPAPHAGR